METKKIYWQELIQMIEQGLEIKDYEIDFRNEKLDFKKVAFLNRNGIKVPEEFIVYDDTDIDFSEDPDLSEEEISQIEMSFTLIDNLSVEPEIKEWIKKEQIDVNKLAAQLITSFYKAVKNIPKNAAL
jgi:hypothetical protein